jgi:hypothetical protein
MVSKRKYSDKPNKKFQEKLTVIEDENNQLIAVELDNTVLLDVHRVSDFPEVTKYIDIIFDQMKALDYIPIQQSHAKGIRENLRAALLSLCAAYFTDPAQYVAYQRGRDAYAPGTRYSKLHFTYQFMIKKVITFLEKYNYIEGKRGFYTEKKSKMSRMRATEHLVDIFVDQAKVTRPMVREMIPDNELVILKDKERKIIDYTDTPETLSMKENLKIINRVLWNHLIYLDLPDDKLNELNNILNNHPDPDKKRGGSLNFYQTQLKRIFNNSSFQQGGRFYGPWWQRVPRDYRKYIKITRKHTVELDYSGLHINMLYAMEKLAMPKGDVYLLPGYSNVPVFRDFVKQMLLIMVNSKSRAATRAALHNAVYTEKSLEKPPEIESTKAEHLYPLMDAFEMKHEEIKHHFNTGKGVDLQYKDSQIAEEVMLYFAKKGYPVLCLHDSFIVHNGLEKELDEQMNKAFYKMFGRKSEIKVKFRSLEVEQLEYEKELQRRGLPGDYTEEFEPGKDLWDETMVNKLEDEFSAWSSRITQIARSSTKT